MSAQFAIAEPRRIKATHRRRRKVTAGRFVQRYYDPQIGRFLSVDPAASEFNRYDYARNNPYRFTDPDGRVAADEAKHKSEQARERRERHEANDRASRSGLAVARAPSAPQGGIGPGYSVPNPVTAGQVVTAGGAATTVGSVVNKGAAVGADVFDKAAARTVGKGLTAAGGALGALELVTGNTAKDQAHGGIMVTAATVEGFFPPSAIVIFPAQLIDAGVQLIPAYQSSSTGEVADGWTGLVSRFYDSGTFLYNSAV